MYLGNFYLSFPLFVVCKPQFPLIGDYLAVFTEELHATRYRKGNQVYVIKNLDDLEHIADHFANDAIGICFDPIDDDGVMRGQRPTTWKMLRMAIELERLDPGGDQVQLPF